MIDSILFFSFIIVGVSIIGFIIDKLIKEICILFNIKTKKKIKTKGKSIKNKKTKSRTSINKKTKPKKVSPPTTKTKSNKISKGKVKVTRNSKKQNK